MHRSHLSYTLGDAYTLDYWMDMAKKVEDMGADSLCIKDMAGLLVPYEGNRADSGIERMQPTFRSSSIHTILPVSLP